MAIVISHPHYYTTHLEWADAFDCPVYLSWEDKQVSNSGGVFLFFIWLFRGSSEFFKSPETFGYSLLLQILSRLGNANSSVLQWLNRLDRLGKARTFIEGTEEELEVRGEKTGVKALKLGGHFPGSLVCLAFGRLLVADTLVTTPSGMGDWSKGPDEGKGGRPPGMTSYSFMWRQVLQHFHMVIWEPRFSPLASFKPFY